MSRPAAPPEATDLVFTPHEYERRRCAASGAMATRRIDLLVVSLHEHLLYLTGMALSDITTPFFLLVDRDGGYTLVIDRATLACTTASAAPEVPPWVDQIDVVVEADSQDLAQLAARTIQRSLDGTHQYRVGYEGGWYALSHSDWSALRSHADDRAVSWCEATDLLVDVRLRKSAEELTVLRRAADAADAAAAAVIAAAAEGASEIELAAAGHGALAEVGSEPSSFPALCGAGQRSGLYHPLPSHRKLQRGDAVEFEMTGAFARYNSNIVRTIFVGAPSPDQRRAFDVVRAAFDQALAVMRPGNSAGQVDDASRGCRARYAGHIPSRTGYGIGLSYPPFFLTGLSLLTGEDRLLEPGMVFSLEPSVSGHGGETIIVGCNVLVTDNGPEVLHHTTRDVITC
jgi:Xaa-Pro aminopeptidase